MATLGGSADAEANSGSRVETRPTVLMEKATPTGVGVTSVHPAWSHSGKISVVSIIDASAYNPVVTDDLHKLTLIAVIIHSGYYHLVTRDLWDFHDMVRHPLREWCPLLGWWPTRVGFAGVVSGDGDCPPYRVSGRW